MKLLFICLGNICRSPTAQAVFEHMAKDAGVWVECDSAGTGNWHSGSAPYASMQKAAGLRGIAMAHLRARQVETRDFEKFDLIIGMDRENYDDLRRICPEEHWGKLHMLLDYADGAAREVPDPYYTRDFETALDLIEAGCAGLLAQVSG
jgi:protein-tyrosine phosphatase